jgi:hypothetical protein
MLDHSHKPWILSATLGCALALACSACDGEKDDDAAQNDPLRDKLDAYLHEGAVNDSLDCLCDVGSEEECEVADVTSRARRNCYLEEAQAEAEQVGAFLDCATEYMEQYTACKMALDSCEAEGAEACEDAYAQMLRCTLPSREVRAAWDACDERF